MAYFFLDIFYPDRVGVHVLQNLTEVHHWFLVFDCVELFGFLKATCVLPVRCGALSGECTLWSPRRHQMRQFYSWYFEPFAEFFWMILADIGSKMHA